ncbi:nucleoside monophosphate kinase [Candidatus Woesearchaeota archaeon]|nr:nucleoside monophosphate kinase [Candidatus Woesearchaeota archaeon]
MSYKLILFGPPGAGKGTQAALISKEYGLRHISTGDIFRKHMKDQTDLGKEILDYMNKGLLVPDELTIKIALNEIKDLNGFILDGFPRTIEQVKALEQNSSVDAAFYIGVSEDTAIKRLCGRKTCSNKTCNEVYHMVDRKPKLENICDKCNSSLYQRSDDNEETVKTRLKEYNTKTAPLLNHYMHKNKLLMIMKKQ